MHTIQLHNSKHLISFHHSLRLVKLQERCKLEFHINQSKFPSSQLKKLQNHIVLTILYDLIKYYQALYLDVQYLSYDNILELRWVVKRNISHNLLSAFFTFKHNLKDHLLSKVPSQSENALLIHKFHKVWLYSYD